MASSDGATRLTEAHRLSQVEVANTTTRMLARAWDVVIDPINLDASAPPWLRLSGGVVRAQARTSAVLSARYYTAFRRLEVGEPFIVEPLTQLDMDAVNTSLRVTGPIAARRAQTTELLERAMQIGRSMSARSGARHALNAGRNTLSAAIDNDSACLGYARATGGIACSFCMMLASRGAVYKSDTAYFRSHDGCSCTAEPVYTTSPTLPAGAEQARELWDQATAGLSGDAARNAFRRAVQAP